MTLLVREEYSFNDSQCKDSDKKYGVHCMELGTELSCQGNRKKSTEPSTELSAKCIVGRVVENVKYLLLSEQNKPKI